MAINYNTAFESDGFRGINLDRGINTVASFKSEAGSPRVGIDVTVTIGLESPIIKVTDENGWIYLDAPLSTVIRFVSTSDPCYEAVDESFTTASSPTINNYFPVVSELIEEFPCIDVVPVNSYNFYRWHEVDGATFPLAESLINCFCFLNGNTCSNFAGFIPKILPDQYRDGGGGNKTSFIQQVSGTRCAFYINYTTPTRIALMDLKLVVSDGKNIVAEDFATMQGINYDGTNHDLFADFEFPQLPNGKYQFALVRLDNSIIYVCNPMEVVTDLQKVGQLIYRNESDKYNFKYSLLPDFKTVVFIKTTVTATTYEDDEEIYKEVSTRKHQAYVAQADRVYELETYWFDQNQHEAMAIAVKYDDLTINGISLQRTGSYTQETTKGGNLSKGLVSFYDQEFAEANNSC
jgi:hypothetical protein